MNKALFFDIEIEKVVPSGEDLHAHHPLGISVAATLAVVDGQEVDLKLWYGQGLPDGNPMPKMPRDQTQVLVKYLERMIVDGWYTIVTWNGLSFDFRVLAVESNLLTECVNLARGPYHIDPMAKGFGLKGKTEGMDGAQAPILWKKGEYDLVKEYVSQDVRTLKDIYLALQDQGMFEWIDRRGSYHNAHIPGGRLLTVQECLALPPARPPHWISDPWPREQFTAWLGGSV